MAYRPGDGNDIGEILELSAECEDPELFDGGFVMKVGRAFKVMFSFAASAMLFIWGVTKICDPENDVRFLFFALGVLIALLLPSVFSYKCTVTKSSIKEEFFILFVRYRKSALWSEVKYKKIKLGRNESVTLYNADKKMLFMFDRALVGYGKILKLAKRNAIKNLR